MVHRKQDDGSMFLRVADWGGGCGSGHEARCDLRRAEPLARSKAGATFKSLGDAWADTTTAHGRLMLTVLGGLAEFERELIRVRTGEGRVRAKARGIHMGRPFKLNRHQQREAIARREAGEALTDIARTFGVHHTTIGRLRA